MFKKVLLTSVISIGITISCVKVDAELGSEFIPGNSDMTYLFDTLRNINSYTSTVTAAATSEWDYALLGNDMSPYWGESKFTFMSTYLPNTGFDEDDVWGTNPVIDSAKFILSSSATYGDTLLTRTITVYALNQQFPNIDDTLHYSDLNGYDYIDPTPICTKDTTMVGTTVEIDLPIEHVTALLDTVGTIYSDDSLFVRKHYGVFVTMSQVAGEGSYEVIDLNSSGIVVYYKSDESIEEAEEEAEDADDDDDVSDGTLEAYFTLSSYFTYNKVVTMIERDFTTADPVLGPDLSIIDTEEPQSVTYVLGQGGLVTNISFDESYFSDIKSAAEEGGYSTVIISHALLKVPLLNPTASNYGLSMPMLGTYYSYAERSLVQDYYLYYVASLSDEVTSYGGLLNRVTGSYSLDITDHIQNMFTDGFDDDEDYDYSTSNHYEIELGPTLGTLEYSAYGSTIDAENIELVIKYFMLK